MSKTMTTMWAKYRHWKHVAAFPLAAGVLPLMFRMPEGSALWITAMVLAGAFGLSYVIEEVVWNLRGTGRPCANCGQTSSMRSFSLHSSCHHCGEQL
ncbi:MAG: hypothetical protein WKF75_16445 [Singulisphaera sp.]